MYRECAASKRLVLDKHLLGLAMASKFSSCIVYSVGRTDNLMRLARASASAAYAALLCSDSKIAHIASKCTILFMHDRMVLLTKGLRCNQYSMRALDLQVRAELQR